MYINTYMCKHVCTCFARGEAPAAAVRADVVSMWRVLFLAALKAILGDEAPSLLEETDGYQPPEVWAEAAALAEQQKEREQQEQGDGYNAGCDSSRSSTDSLHRLPSYDIWGVGLIFLKLALGTPTPLESVDGRKSARVRRSCCCFGCFCCRYSWLCGC